MGFKCQNCGNRARFRCIHCHIPLCERCRSRWKIGSNLIQGVIANYFKPAGLCKTCRSIVIIGRSIHTTMKVMTFTQRLLTRLH